MAVARRAVSAAGQYATELRVLTRAGIIKPYPPHVLYRIVKALAQWGTGPAGGFTALAARVPDKVGLIDELGELTFREMHERSNALADSLRRHGVKAGDGVAIMCRNHRGFVDASIAAAKLGADLLYLNTAFAGPQLVDVLEREEPAVVIHDEEFGDVLKARDPGERILAWTDSEDVDEPTLEQLIREGSTADHTPPEKPSRIIILTSGTTGTPKGAPRSEAGIDAAASLLSRLPLKQGWRTHIAAPLFHTWGWAHWALSMLQGSTADHTPPEKPSRIIILTSGTTGTPKGAPRSEAGIDAAASLLSRLPLKQGWRTHIAAPLFHTWGWAHWALSMLLESTVVLHRRFDPEECLKAVTEHRCDSLVVIPVMLQRILRLPQETLDSYDLSHVKVVAASGSALPGDLGLHWMDQFGDTLFNIYGSTEVAYATIASPQDLRDAPGTAGKPPWATVVKILDENGRELPQGESGRIFVGNTLLFEGYTGGGHKEVVDGLMSSGDVGRFDENGHLIVEGRDDEMIVSGGENVFPKEVEDCLTRHDAVVEAAAIGVDDEDFGKRLRAFVVLHEKGGVDEDALKEHVKANLARYKVPREIVFVDELPRNATGKVLKKDLHEIDLDEATSA